jgi:hypothetical protein
MQRGGEKYREAETIRRTDAGMGRSGLACSGVHRISVGSKCAQSAQRDCKSL